MLQGPPTCVVMLMLASADPHMPALCSSASQSTESRLRTHASFRSQSHPCNQRRRDVDHHTWRQVRHRHGDGEAQAVPSRCGGGAAARRAHQQVVCESAGGTSRSRSAFAPPDCLERTSDRGALRSLPADAGVCIPKPLSIAFSPPSTPRSNAPASSSPLSISSQPACKISSSSP